MIQQWWSDIVRWFNSDAGQTVVTSAIIPFLAILVGAIIAGLIARSSIKRLLAQQDREHKAAAVAALIASGRNAASWSSLSAQEKNHLEHQVSEAEVRVRLLPVAGAGLAADWAAHLLDAMKRNSATFTFQAEQDLVDFQDGLIAWQSKPSRARKLFAQDLAAWKYASATPAEDEMTVKQREWAAGQASPTTTPAASATADTQVSPSLQTTPS
jgi:hypothetical protein